MASQAEVSTLPASVSSRVSRTRPGGAWEGLCTVRDLRSEVITVPGRG